MRTNSTTIATGSTGQNTGLNTGPSSELVAERAAERAEVLAKATVAREVSQRPSLTTVQKNEILMAAADALVARTSEILTANALDISAGRERGMDEALIDRLRLTADRVEGIASGLRQVADLPDPVGDVVRGSRRPNGLEMRQVRVPLGVMGMVYEARPNVTVDAFGLALKSGNVPLLRGSKSAQHSNSVLVDILQDVLEASGQPREMVQLLPCVTHDSVQDLITARGLVDIVIPRGGAGLINAVVTGATVPTIETGTGNCHFYVDASADVDEATALVINGKTRRCSVCNATETVLLDAGLPLAAKKNILCALQDAGVTLHADLAELSRLDIGGVVAAKDSDWDDEFGSMDIAVKIVDGVEAAVDHIRAHSTGHTEAIGATDIRAIQYFTANVDAAAVMVNTSTAWTDGEMFGFGAEIGISTQKLHARGPMGLPELTSTKWIVTGEGQVRP